MRTQDAIVRAYLKDLQRKGLAVLDDIMLDLDAAEYARIRRALLVAYDLVKEGHHITSSLTTNMLRIRYAIDVVCAEHPPPNAGVTWEGQQLPGMDTAKCQICGTYTMPSREAMLYHIRTTHIVGNWTTPFCRMPGCPSFGHRFGLAAYPMHMILLHKVALNEGPVFYPEFPGNVCYDHRCDEYKKVFKCKEQRDQHYRDVHVPRGLLAD